MLNEHRMGVIGVIMEQDYGLDFSRRNGWVSSGFIVFSMSFSNFMSLSFREYHRKSKKKI
jgi:amino acid permease